MLTHETLCSKLIYNWNDGRLYWVERGRGILKKKNLQAGSYDAHGYGQIVIDRKVYKEHRLVWMYFYGEMPSKQIDHINHERRDNRIENLRVVDNKENHRNRPKQSNNKSGFVGVWKNRSAYCAYITVNGKRIYLGSFKSIDEAVLAREAANKKYGYHKMHGSGYGKSRAKPLNKDEIRKNAFFIEYDGRQMIAAEWAKEPGCTVREGVIRTRIRNGWNPHDAIFLPPVTAKQRAWQRGRRSDGTFDNVSYIATYRQKTKELKNEN